MTHPGSIPPPFAPLNLNPENKQPVPEAVNHPAHYGGEDNPYETIKVIEALGWGKHFCLGNALKYMTRAGIKSKQTELQDYEKARFYLDRVIKQEQAAANPPNA